MKENYCSKKANPFSAAFLNMGFVAGFRIKHCCKPKGSAG